MRLNSFGRCYCSCSEWNNEKAVKREADKFALIELGKLTVYKKNLRQDPCQLTKFQKKVQHTSPWDIHQCLLNV